MTQTLKLPALAIESKTPAHLLRLLPSIFDSFYPFLFVMERYFPIHAATASDDVILAPKLINPKVDDLKDFDKFKLNSR